MRFRPCIDLHEGRVKQIVGGTLRDDPGSAPVTHYVATQPPAYFASLYRRDALEGGHVIMLGPGNDAAAAEALAAYPGGLQVGGGITDLCAAAWLHQGAAKVIVTSYAFAQGTLSEARLTALLRAVPRERLVLDLSCRKRDGRYYVVTNRWQTFTDFALQPASIDRLGDYCSELLVHAVDVEGRQEGIDLELVEWLAAHAPLPVTYAGGVRSLADVHTIERAGRGRLDVTVGSALDLFGGGGVAYADMVALDRRWRGGGHAEAGHGGKAG